MSKADVEAHQARHGFLQAPPASQKVAEPVKLPKPRQPNRTEREYALILKAKFPNSGIRYEGYTLKLADGCRYIPDFAVEHRDGTLEFHEVKGAFIFSKALTKPKTAAELFPQRFVLAQKFKHGWQISPLPGRYDRA